MLRHALLLSMLGNSAECLLHAGAVTLSHHGLYRCLPVHPACSYISGYDGVRRGGKENAFLAYLHASAVSVHVTCDAHLVRQHCTVHQG
jgi:hypothetical protein